MTFPRYMEGKDLLVPLTSWLELCKRKDEAPFIDMINAARKAITEDGAFIVYRESDTSVIYRCDRMTELESLLA